MKKYSNKHLEKVEPEFISALGVTINRMSEGYACDDRMTCPFDICEHEDPGYDSECYKWCPTNFVYEWEKINRKEPCPCYKFGRDRAIAMALNLVSQWKAWAGLVG